MSREDVELVVRHFKDTNAERVEAAVGAFAGDVVLRFHGDLAVLAGEGADGKTAVVEWFRDWFRTFEPGYRFEVEQVSDWDGRVFVVATHHGRGRTSGAPMERRTAWVYTIRDGRIARCDGYPDPESALEDAGRRE